jgi:hypothetical protein
MDIDKKVAAGIIGGFVAGIFALVGKLNEPYTHEPIKVLERSPGLSTWHSAGMQAAAQDVLKVKEKPLTFAPQVQKFEEGRFALARADYYWKKFKSGQGTHREKLNDLNAVFGALGENIKNAPEIGLTPRELAGMMRQEATLYLQELQARGGLQSIQDQPTDSLQKFMMFQDAVLAYGFVGIMDDGKYDITYVAQITESAFPRMSQSDIYSMSHEHMVKAYELAIQNFQKYSRDEQYDIPALMRFMEQYAVINSVPSGVSEESPVITIKVAKQKLQDMNAEIMQRLDESIKAQQKPEPLAPRLGH